MVSKIEKFDTVGKRRLSSIIYIGLEKNLQSKKKLWGLGEELLKFKFINHILFLCSVDSVRKQFLKL